MFLIAVYDLYYNCVLVVTANNKRIRTIFSLLTIVDPLQFLSFRSVFFQLDLN